MTFVQDLIVEVAMTRARTADELENLGRSSPIEDSVAYAAAWRSFFMLAAVDIPGAKRALEAVDKAKMGMLPNRQLLAVAEYRIALREGHVDAPEWYRTSEESESEAVRVLRNLARGEAIIQRDPGEAPSIWAALLESIPGELLSVRRFVLQRLIEVASPSEKRIEWERGLAALVAAAPVKDELAQGPRAKEPGMGFVEDRLCAVRSP
jgi:hypothetical protein